MTRFLLASLLMIALCTPLIGYAGEQVGLSPADIQALQEQGRREGWTFSVGENSATGRPLGELCGTVMPSVIPPAPPPRGGMDFSPRGSLPVYFDWREFGGLPSIKNQGQCGSCWAFGTMGPMECNLMLRGGIEYDLSEQWLVSCNQDGWGCDGGWIAHDYHTCDGSQDPCGHSGAVFEADFPYQAQDLPCECPYDHPFCLDTWGYVNEGPWYPEVEDVKRAIIEHGPVAALVYVGSAFQGYNNGVFNACGTGDLNHLITLVGWDDTQGDNGIWIMRNSWGPGWGEGGYMRIQYDCACIGYITTWVEYDPRDCDNNGIDDITEPGYADCNENGVMDSCEPAGDQDCNANQIMDLCEIYSGACSDCNGNFVPDDCDIASSYSEDCNFNGVPDECEVGHDVDCNINGVDDLCDIYNGVSTDCNTNGVPDECEPLWDQDCNDNQIMDICDIQAGTSKDDDGNWIPDECQSVRVVPSAEYPTIQSAIDAAGLGDTVLIKDGVYVGAGNKNLDFRGKRILIVRAENGPANCVIDMEGSGNGFYFHTGEDATALVEGLTIANGSYGVYCMRSSPVVRNCVIVDHGSAGVVCARACTPLISNCLISGNRKGGVSVSGCKPTIDHCTIVGNKNTSSGGGIGVGSYGGEPHARVYNSIIWNNRAGSGPQIAVGVSSSLSIDYCCVQGGEDELELGFQASLNWGGGNLDEDPTFIAAGHWDDNGTPNDPKDDVWVSGDCRLAKDSPCIDVGNPKGDYTDRVDLEGQPRLMNGRVDIGMDEFALAGDLNCDGLVDDSDVNPFVLALVAPSLYEDRYPDCHHFQADCNGDGLVDFGDINPFVVLVSGK